MQHVGTRPTPPLATQATLQGPVPTLQQTSTSPATSLSHADSWLYQPGPLRATQSIAREIYPIFQQPRPCPNSPDLRKPRHSIFEVIKVFLNAIEFWFNQGTKSSSYDVLKVHPCEQDPYQEWVCKSNLFKSNKVSLFYSITQSCPILCDLMDCSPIGF